MRGFFGDLLCECQSAKLHEYALTTPDGVVEVTELLVICVDCKVAFYESADTDMRPSPAPLRGRRQPHSARGAPAAQGDRMATAKKTTAAKTATKTPTKTTRGRNQDRALVATMEDYEVKYLAQKHSVTQKAVKDAVAKVGHSRTKVERELKSGKAS